MKRTRSLSCEEGKAKQHPPAQQIPQLLSLLRPVSPPRLEFKNHEKKSEVTQISSPTAQPSSSPDLAAIEAGEIEVADHLAIYSKSLGRFARWGAKVEQHPRISIPVWKDLYSRNEHPHGCHFVIHQHDHPLAGPHYDLRLQFSETSSVSWSIMYGFPGDPNSQQLNRNATETRVHCLWDHLNESASSLSGSMIIWDTGEYEVLPYHVTDGIPETDNSQSDTSSNLESPNENVSESTKLQQAFRNRKIRLRLHGTRLPKGYTVSLCMDKSSNFTRKITKGPKRRRRGVAPARAPSTTDSESEPSTSTGAKHSRHSEVLDSDYEGSNHRSSDQDPQGHSGHDREFQIRKNNAYPGSFNTIGSVHQRRWFLSLDRINSGFQTAGKEHGNSTSGKKVWTRRPDGGRGLRGFEPFHVRGPDVERSVVTGRLGQDVLEDHAVQGFQRRKGWMPVLK
ncbi:hypothetical protein N7492_009480 [Penicillium capsulatum]|uniref:DNA ligase D 3'-phosphoesterase domain-containing protein n=1 Tax=Penicillium capsulatum TaxID=69766 RepID=A0A9W9HSW2_9EURO|nr:hypothetical protein N7492_009480 [Penicillium capsulatum]KAJ6106870.1 hypothetical protein N7512_010387 [Penicillium capsulatum]